jgi:hypothetical protein
MTSESSNSPYDLNGQNFDAEIYLQKLFKVGIMQYNNAI